MGLFNRKKKQQLIEIKNEFNYDKMLEEAKFYNIFDGGKLYNVINTQNKYEKSGEKTGLVGVYNKNNKLLVVLKYDLDQNILFNYLIQSFKTFEYIFDNIKLLPVTIEERDKTLLSNYSNIEILRSIKKINEQYCADEICPYTGMFVKNVNVGGSYLECSIGRTMLLGYEEPTAK